MNHYGHSPQHRPPITESVPGRQEPSPLAWATLAFGILSWVMMPFVAAVAALACGLVERRRMARGEASEAGRTHVIVGLVLAAIQLGLVALALVLIVGAVALMALGVVLL